MLDTGGQYLDGTTDVSRTFHFGTASDFEREVYTRVLMGSIDLARATFLDGTPDTRLDILARWNLYKVGLNYRHGTGKKLKIFSIDMITTIHGNSDKKIIYIPNFLPVPLGISLLLNNISIIILVRPGKGHDRPVYLVDQ